MYYIAYRDPDYQPVAGPDARVHTKAFPAHMLAELAEEQLQSQAAFKAEVQFFNQLHQQVAAVVMNVVVPVDQEVQAEEQED